MGALLSLPTSLLNFLLPFTSKSTPLYQDLIHTVILCGTLYFGPQLVELYNARTQQDQPTHDVPAGAGADTNDIPIDEGFVLQEEDEDGDPPPRVPTPPPDGHAHHEPPFPADDAQWPPNAQNDFDAGPANERPRPTPANRAVGAKKAKSLARKDQRRAYFEFHRQQAEIERQRLEAGREEREAAQAAEKARRAEAERKIQEKGRVEREKKKEEEKREAEMERERRQRVIDSVREGVRNGGAVDLVALAKREGKEREWVERLVSASGVITGLEKEDQSVKVMITGGGWLVRIDWELMREAYATAIEIADKKGGKMGLDEFGGILEKMVRSKMKGSEKGGSSWW